MTQYWSDTVLEKTFGGFAGSYIVVTLPHDVFLVRSGLLDEFPPLV